MKCNKHFKNYIWPKLLIFPQKFIDGQNGQKVFGPLWAALMGSSYIECIELRVTLVNSCVLHTTLGKDKCFINRKELYANIGVHEPGLVLI